MPSGIVSQRTWTGVPASGVIRPGTEPKAVPLGRIQSADQSLHRFDPDGPFARWDDRHDVPNQQLSRDLRTPPTHALEIAACNLSPPLWPHELHWPYQAEITRLHRTSTFERLDS